MTDIKETIKALNKALGRNVIMSGEEVPPPYRVRIIPAIDYVSNGGLPGNKMIELIGDPSAGKSWLMYRAIAEFQKMDWNTRKQNAILKVEWSFVKIKGKTDDDDESGYYEAKKLHTARGVKDPYLKRCVLIDYEKSFDPVWATAIGVDVKGLIVIQPELPSEAVNITETLLQDPNISFIGLDSVGAIGSDAEIQAAQEDNQMSANARFWNKAVRKFTAAMNANPESDITFMFINRFYEKVGLVFGDPKVTSSGSGLRFGKHLSLYLKSKKVDKVKLPGVERDVAVGKTIEVEGLKSKVGRPHLVTDFYFATTQSDTHGYKEGQTDEAAQLIDIGLLQKVIVREGNSFVWRDYKVLGKQKFLEKLEKDDVLEDLTKDIYSTYK